MASQAFLVERGVDGAVVRLSDKRLDESNVEAVGEGLSRLVEELGQPRLRLDLGGVGFVSSEGLGKLVALHKQMRSVGGHLILCNVDAFVYEVFQVTCLDRLLDIRPKEAV